MSFQAEALEFHGGSGQLGICAVRDKLVRLR